MNEWDFRSSKSKAAFSISHLSVCLSCAFLVRSKKTKRRKLTYCKVDLVHTPVKARQSREERAGVTKPVSSSRNAEQREQRTELNGIEYEEIDQSSIRS